MACCGKCNHVFRDNRDLDKHLLRKIPCKEPLSEFQCKFCYLPFTRINNKNRHEKICKERNLNESILILNFGETDDKITLEEIIDELRIIVKTYDPTQTYLMAGDLINRYDRQLLKTPENNNLVIPDSKCLYAEIKSDIGWEKVPIDNVLNTSFKDRASKLIIKQPDIDNHNKRVFKSATTKRIFVEIKQFANKGFNYYQHGDELRKVRTSHKINKIKIDLKKK